MSLSTRKLVHSWVQSSSPIAPRKRADWSKKPSSGGCTQPDRNTGLLNNVLKSGSPYSNGLLSNRKSGPFRLGYVGRLTPEKDVRFLAKLERSLTDAGAGPFGMVIVGDGSERGWLARHTQQTLLTGALTGTDLAQEYANMDLFVFPSRTETFGNVVLEAMASGVPAVVTDQGGARFLVEDGISGRVAPTDEGFTEAVAGLMRDHELHSRMRLSARARAEPYSWDYVFEQQVFGAYRACSAAAARPGVMMPGRFQPDLN
jgi:phosphatidylinositol alpha 1,6-mannosyltransferase